ncbi:uncharacterized protein A4U43_C08F21930 [Asparagus officinalis]|nr:uncharacterized protein A4U43_C08F21930 [Asparagus officinalis]
MEDMGSMSECAGKVSVVGKEIADDDADMVDMGKMSEFVRKSNFLKLIKSSLEMDDIDKESGLEVFPTANPTVLEQLRKVDCIIYGMGSLFTSICPSLVTFHLCYN